MPECSAASRCTSSKGYTSQMLEMVENILGKKICMYEYIILQSKVILILKKHIDLKTFLSFHTFKASQILESMQLWY